MQKIKIGMDISQIAHQGGVGIYTQRLAEELIKIPELEMRFFYSSLRIPYTGKLPYVKKYKLPPTFFEFLFNNIRAFPIENFIGEVDIFHSSDWTQPTTKAKKITTIHDVVPLKYPEWSHPKIVEVQKRRLRLVEREIDLVIAVSESTKKDLLEVSNIPAEKIVVIYEGVSDVFKPKSSHQIAEFKKRYNLPAEFILAIGGIGERRNLKNIKKASQDFKLVVTGEDIPHLKEAELPLLYGSAKVLLYPSFYEGFGLPILEAMACGVPVITSCVSSMTEIANGFALLVDPNDLSQMTSQLKKLMTDQNLRADLVNKGLKRAKNFSWQKCAIETANVYKKLANQI